MKISPLYTVVIFGLICGTAYAVMQLGVAPGSERQYPHLPQEMLQIRVQQQPVSQSYLSALQNYLSEYFTWLAYAIWRNAPEQIKEALTFFALPRVLWRR